MLTNSTSPFTGRCTTTSNNQRENSMIPVQHTLETPYMVGPVHCYSAEIAGELVLFDTGPPTEEARQSLQRSLALKQLRHVIVTHCHIDHYGLAHWLEQNTDAVIYLPFRDHLKIMRHHERLELMFELLQQIGFTPDFLENFRSNMEDGSVFPCLPQNFQIIEENLPKHLGLEILACPGHSQSDLVLIGDRWAVTGDVMLRGIFQTPLLDIDLLTEQRFRNYDAYCSSLSKLATLRDKLILPGHRQSIDSVDSCLLFYVGKLLERARHIKKFPLSMNAVEVISALFKTDLTNPFISYLKASEIVFIRDFLAEPQRLQSVLEDIDLFDQVEKAFVKALT